MQHARTANGSMAERQTLAALYDAVARGDVDVITVALSDDIEWRVNGPSPVAGVYQGKEAVLAFFPRMMAQYEGTLQVEVLGVLADDPHGVVRVAERADRPGDGVSYSGVHIWEFREGRCAKFESLYDDAYHRFWSGRAGTGESAQS